jgi:hypothetical protein
VLQYERCMAEPLVQYRRTLEHLGVEDFTPTDPGRLRGNSLAAHRESPSPELSTALHNAFADEVAELAELTDGAIDPALWPHFREVAARA